MAARRLARLEKALKRNGASAVVMHMVPSSEEGESFATMSEGDMRAEALKALKQLGEALQGEDTSFYRRVLRAVCLEWAEERAVSESSPDSKLDATTRMVTPGIDALAEMLQYVDPACREAGVLTKQARVLGALDALKVRLLAGASPPKAALYELTCRAALSILRARRVMQCMVVLDGLDSDRTLSVDLSDLTEDAGSLAQQAVVMTWIRHAVRASDVNSTYLSCLSKPDKQLPPVRKFFKGVLKTLHNDEAIVVATAKYVRSLVRCHAVEGGAPLRILSADRDDVLRHLVDTCYGIFRSDGTDAAAERVAREAAV
jgi:hypothetical protein